MGIPFTKADLYSEASTESFRCCFCLSQIRIPRARGDLKEAQRRTPGRVSRPGQVPGRRARGARSCPRAPAAPRSRAHGVSGGAQRPRALRPRSFCPRSGLGAARGGQPRGAHPLLARRAPRSPPRRGWALPRAILRRRWKRGSSLPALADEAGVPRGVRCTSSAAPRVPAARTPRP